MSTPETPSPSAAPATEPRLGDDARSMPDGTIVTCEHSEWPHPKGDDGRPCRFPKVAVSAPASPRPEEPAKRPPVTDPEHWHLCRHDILKIDCDECAAPSPSPGATRLTEDEVDRLDRENEASVFPDKTKRTLLRSIRALQTEAPRADAETVRRSFALTEVENENRTLRRRLDSALRVLDRIGRHDGTTCDHTSPTDCLFAVAEEAARENGAAVNPNRIPQLAPSPGATTPLTEALDRLENAFTMARLPTMDRDADIIAKAARVVCEFKADRSRSLRRLRADEEGRAPAAIFEAMFERGPDAFNRSERETIRQAIEQAWHAGYAARAPSPSLPDAPRVLTGCQMKDTPETRELVAAAGRMLAAAPARETPVPCGGRACWRAPDGGWVHAVLSGDSCSVRRDGTPIPALAPAARSTPPPGPPDPPHCATCGHGYAATPCRCSGEARRLCKPSQPCAKCAKYVYPKAEPAPRATDDNGKENGR
jgi:hypothetical protein